MRSLAILLAAFLPGLAFANCNGVDQLPMIQRDDPAGYEKLMSAAQTMPNGQGVFWKVTKGDLAPSYLIGTNHVVSEAAKAVIGDFKSAVSGARVLMVELTKAEEEEMQQALATDPSLIFDTSGRTLVDYLPPEEHDLAEQAFGSVGLDFNTGSRLSPTFVQILLAIPVCAQIAAAANPELKMDSSLRITANDAGIPVIGLETWERQLAAFSSHPRDLQEASARTSILLWPEIENNFATVEAMYHRGQIALIWEYSRHISLNAVDASLAPGAPGVDESMAAIQTELLDNRNIEMAAKVTEQVEQGGAAVAVGALHLAGATGLVELLREQGYTVERIK